MLLPVRPAVKQPIGRGSTAVNFLAVRAASLGQRIAEADAPGRAAGDPDTVPALTRCLGRAGACGGRRTTRRRYAQ